MTISLVPAFIVMSFNSSFHFLAVKYLHGLSPYLVVLTLGKGKTYSWRLRLYLKERKLIRFLIARGALFDMLLCIVNEFFEIPWRVVLSFPIDANKMHVYHYRHIIRSISNCC